MLGQRGGRPDIRCGDAAGEDVATLLLEPRREPRPLLLGSAKLGIIWSAKSACTTVLLWYLWHRNLLQTARAYSSWPHNFRNRVLYADDEYRTWASQVEAGGWTWVRVMRDPYKRAISSYRHTLVNGYEDGKMSRRLKRPPEQGYSFEEFLDYLLRIDVTICNLHHKQQFHPLEELVTPSRVVNVNKEDLMQALAEIDLGLATPQEPREALLGAIAAIDGFHHARRSTIDRDVSAVPLTRQDGSGEWPAYSCFLNASTREKIARIYAVDISRYAAFL
ncbi:MAG TPA: sulfotransferase family 2 domain-containing protein [Dongiaceae bacterium]|nr:sulfotransferase family 2 domain-containing protein [Dongiaceae bacterium]